MEGIVACTKLLVPTSPHLPLVKTGPVSSLRFVCSCDLVGMCLYKEVALLLQP